MAHLSEIPLDAAGEPGVPKRQIGHLEDRIAEQELSAEDLVVQRIQTHSVFRQEDRFQAIVLKLDRLERDRLPRSLVYVLHPVRQNAPPHLIAIVVPFRFQQFGVIAHGTFRNRAELRKTVFFEPGAARKRQR